MEVTRFEVQREEKWTHTQPIWSIAVRDRLLELFYDQISLMLQYAMALDVILVFDLS